MRDFFWFTFLSLAMYVVADYHATMKSTSVVQRNSSASQEKIEKAAFADGFEVFIAGSGFSLGD